MTAKNMEARREAFERWYVAHAIAAGVQTTITDMVGMRGKEGEYRAYPVLHGKWLGYNAALDSICVELPQCDPSEAVQYGAALDDFKQSLTAAGVAYK